MTAEKPAVDRLRTVLVAVAVAASLAVGGVAFAGATPAADAGPAGFALQDGNETAGNGTAGVRVVHASPDAPNVDVLLDGETVLENVSFGTVSDYLDVPAGERTVTVTVAGNRSQVVLEVPLLLEGGVNYSVIASGEVGEDATQPFGSLLLRDEPTDPGAGNASARLVHLSPDAPAVDVTVAGTDLVLFDDVTFGDATGYVTVPAGNYTLEVRPATAANDGPVVFTANVSLPAGAAASAFAVGYLNVSAAPVDEPFRVVPAVDRTVPATPTENVTAANETPTTTAAPSLEEVGNLTPRTNRTATPTVMENETAGNETAGDESASVPGGD